MKKIIDFIKTICDLISKLMSVFNFFKETNNTKKIEEYTKTRCDELFNEKLDNCQDTSKCDAIRKDKQEMINNLIKSVLFLLFFITIGGCGITSKPVSDTEILDKYDIHQLKTTDETYRICQDKAITVIDKGNKNQYRFDENWFVVHKDLLKQHNENQNFIIDTLSNDNSWISKILYIVIILLLIFIAAKNMKR